jgi:protein-tyrosine phosphatase
MHTHVLPGVDDGAPTLAHACAMLRAAQAVGITHLIATAHYTERYAADDACLCAAYDSLCAQCGTDGVPIVLARGREVSFTDTHLAAVRGDARLCMPNGKFALLETPEGLNASAMVEGFFSLSVAGIQPILAHPERSWTFQRQPAMLEKVRQHGVLLQVDAPSIMGNHGSAAKQLAFALLARNAVAMLSSDAHCPEDFTILQRACGVVQARYGAALVAQLVSEMPARLLT